MKVTDIPFVQHIGIEQDKSELSLGCNGNVMNHLRTIHAGAQFALAETQSGIYLQTLFPGLEGKVVPVLRDAQIRYKKPAVEKISAFVSSSQRAVEKFRIQFEKKGRGVLEVSVEVKDINETLVSEASFKWFIQAL